MTSRASKTLIPIALVILAAPFLWASKDTWEKHMSAGENAYARALEKKFYYSGSNNPRILADFAKSEKEFLAALAVARASSVKDLREAQTLGELAALSMEEGDLAEAEQRGNQSLASTEAVVGPDDPRMGKALANMALLYDSESKPELAAPLWSRSANILKRPGAVDLNWLSNLNSKAALMLTFPDRQEQMLKFIVEIQESTGAPERDRRAFIAKLAKIQQGPNAEQTYGRLLEIDKNIYGPDSIETNQDKESLARVYCDEGKFAAAVPLSLHALQARRANTRLYESEIGKSIDQSAILRLHKAKLEKSFYDSDLGWLNRELVQAYTRTAKYADAEALLTQLVSADEAKTSSKLVLGNLDLIEDCISLSTAYREEHRYDEAIDALKRADESNEVIENSKFGRVHKDSNARSVWTWIIQSERAEIYREKGDMAAAEPLFLSSLEMAQALMQQPVPMLPGNPPFARLLDHYASLLRDEGKTAESETYYKRALDSWSKSRFPEHPDVAETLTDYAVLLRRLNRPAEADTLEKRASTILANAVAPSQVR